jgi:cytochrome c oxidase subunit 1
MATRRQAEAHAGRRHEPYAGVSNVGLTNGDRQGPNDPDPT